MIWIDDDDGVSAAVPPVALGGTSAAPACAPLAPGAASLSGSVAGALSPADVGDGAALCSALLGPGAVAGEAGAAVTSGRDDVEGA